VDQQFIRTLRRFLIFVVPDSAARLRSLRSRARRIPNAGLRKQAIASIEGKDFHVHGGCILATFLPKREARRFIELVATFETAVDYLDNLCDRAGNADERDFRALHEALGDAVNPRAPLRSYFRYRSEDDGGYLNELVVRSQNLLRDIPSYSVIEPYVREVTARYCELQALKHLAAGTRELRCQETFKHTAPEMSWWEGAAACGSTLPTFALVFGALQGCDTGRARELHKAYFPWISGFHILLDYFIDQAEDKKHGELNFVACYEDGAAARDGIVRTGTKALEWAAETADPEHHIFAIRAMCGFYCTQAKVDDQRLGADASAIASAVGVELSGGAWLNGRSRTLGSLLSLYRKMIRT
jgi:tetraprenyl-beta-curcumene synthase